MNASGRDLKLLNLLRVTRLKEANERADETIVHDNRDISVCLGQNHAIKTHHTLWDRVLGELLRR